MQHNTVEALAGIHNLLGSPTRLIFVRELAAGPKTGAQLAAAAGVGVSAVSQHMISLRAAGAIERRREGKSIRFHLVEPRHALVTATLALLKAKG